MGGVSPPVGKEQNKSDEEVLIDVLELYSYAATRWPRRGESVACYSRLHTAAQLLRDLV